MKHYGITDKGKLREDNQDSFCFRNIVAKNCLIVSLCDGMGGAAAGDLASTLGCESFTDSVLAVLTCRTEKKPDYEKAVRRGCDDANRTVYEYALIDAAYFGMGSTLVGAVIDEGGRAVIANIGDSRCYIIRKKEKSIRQITADHSLVESFVRAGVISEAEAKVHPKKNIITRALGAEPYVVADVFEEQLKRGDSLLFCSDGLTNFVEDEEILKVCLNSPQPRDICRALIDLTLERGAADNVTVISVVR